MKKILALVLALLLCILLLPTMAIGVGETGNNLYFQYTTGGDDKYYSWVMDRPNYVGYDGDVRFYHKTGENTYADVTSLTSDNASIVQVEKKEGFYSVSLKSAGTVSLSYSYQDQNVSFPYTVTNQAPLYMTIGYTPISSNDPQDYFSGMSRIKGLSGAMFPIQFYTTHPITDADNLLVPWEAGPIGYDSVSGAWFWSTDDTQYPGVAFGNHTITCQENGTSFSAKVYVSDYCGTDVLCSLSDDEKTLSIELEQPVMQTNTPKSGGAVLAVPKRGAMNDYDSSAAPWANYQDQIETVSIGNGVTSIGKKAFASCTNLTSVSVPESVKSIGANAFEGCGSFTVNYAGSEDEWKKMTGTSTLSSATVNFAKDNDSGSSGGGCYVATAVYGSYDCPEVWTLRRFRDETLAQTWYGRAFIHTYYAVSPTLVKWFGDTDWFKNMWRGPLDRMVENLNAKGVADTPYDDIDW